MDGSITAYTIATGVTPQKIDAMLCRGEYLQIRCGAIVIMIDSMTGHQPLRSIASRKTT